MSLVNFGCVGGVEWVAVIETNDLQPILFGVVEGVQESLWVDLVGGFRREFVL